MRKKYLLEAGTSPLWSSVEVEGGSFPPMHVYHFSILHQVKRLLQTKELLEGAMWMFMPKCHLNSNEWLYDTLNSGQWWEFAEHEMHHDLDLLDALKPPGLLLCFQSFFLMTPPFVTTLGISSHSPFCVPLETSMMTCSIM
jgi:hypothetical protein